MLQALSTILAGSIIGLAIGKLVDYVLGMPQYVYQVSVYPGGDFFSGISHVLPGHIYSSEETAKHVCIVLTSQAYHNGTNDLYLYTRMIVRNRANLVVIRQAKPTKED